MFDRLTFSRVHQPISTQVKALSVAGIIENMRGPGDRFAGLSIAVEPRRSFLDGPRSAEPKTPTSPTSPRQPGARTWLAHQEAADRAAPKRKRDFEEAFAPPWEPHASERATFWDARPRDPAATPDAWIIPGPHAAWAASCRDDDSSLDSTVYSDSS